MPVKGDIPFRLFYIVCFDEKGSPISFMNFNDVILTMFFRCVEEKLWLKK